MPDFDSIQGARLIGGFIIAKLSFVPSTLVDAVGRPALAESHIVGKQIDISIAVGQDAAEISVTLYHEILEAVTVASTRVPLGVQEFNEADFERAAYAAHERFGPASPANLSAMLLFFGFRED